MRLREECMSRRYFSTHRFQGVQILSACNVFLDIALKNSLKLWVFHKYDTGGEIKNDAHSELEFVGF
jgi:hypothetical protein